MFRLLIITLATILGAFSISPCLAQDNSQTVSDSSQVLETAPAMTQSETETEKPKDTRSLREKLYFGGSVGLTFGDYTSIRISPLVAYKVQPKLSVGVQVGYEYLRDTRFSETLTSHNYGGSIFSRYRVLPQLYAHAEYALVNYEIHTTPTTSERESVPYLFLGGGYSQKIGPGTWAFAQVVVDVLQSSKSPYDDWEPFVSFGVSIGF